MKHVLKLIGEFFYSVIVVLVIIIKELGPSTKKSRKKVIKKIRRKYRGYEIAELYMHYTDWSSSIRVANDDHKATSAKAVIKKGDLQRTLHLSRSFGIWHITNDAPDHGPDVPENAYFIERSVASVGKRLDIEESVRQAWVIPYEDGKLYHISGNDEYWCYVYIYIRNIYKTQNEKVYVLNKKTFEWELTELLYSTLDYYGNYDSIDRKEAEEIIVKYRNRQSD